MFKVGEIVSMGSGKRVFKGGEINAGTKQVFKSLQGRGMNRFLIGNDIVIRVGPYQEWVSVKNSRVDTWAVALELIGFWSVARALNG